MTPNDSSTAQWFCVRTQTKREHIAAQHLRGLDGVEVFCPRIRYRKATRRGKIWWVEPLFPGYILAKFDIQTMERAVAFCQGVRGLVRFGSIFPAVPDTFVESLRHEVCRMSESLDDTETFAVSPTIEIGDEVEIANGPLRGMSGTIVEVASATERVKVLLEFLGEEQAVDLDLFSLILPKRPALAATH